MESLSIGLIFGYLTVILASCQILAQQVPKPTRSFIETEILGLRVWMIIGLIGVGFMIIIIVLCCIFDCRIPRTKQQIDLDYERREMIQNYENKILAMQAKKSRFAQARQRAAMFLGEMGMEGGGPTKHSKEDRTKESTLTSDVQQNNRDSTPLAQHPAAVLMGPQESRNNLSNKPLGASMHMPIGNSATARTLASLDNGGVRTNSAL